MKKLNKTELSVIAMRIRDKLQDTYRKAVKDEEAAQDKDNLELAKAIQGDLNKLSKPARDFLLSHYSRYNTPSTIKKAFPVSSIIQRIRQKSSLKQPANYNEILDELIIAQIDSPDVNVLISRVTKRFQ